MLKLLSFSLLILHCHCVPVFEVGGGDVQRKLDLSSGVSYSRGLSGLSSLGSLGIGGVRYSGYGSSLGGLQTVGVRPLGIGSVRYSGYGSSLGGLQTVGVQPVSGVDLSGLSGISSYGVRPGVVGLGYGSIGGLRTNALNFGVSQVGVNPVGYGVVQAVQPAVQTVAVQPAVQTVGVNTIGVNALNVGYGQRVSQQVVPVSAAIQQVGRTVEYRSVPFNDQQIVPQVVEVEPSDNPVHIHFKSRSSSVRLSQEHIAGEPGTVERTQSQDEPSKVIHEVVKPVIQEVREVITPYRQVVQEVQPVVESVHTVVAKGEGERRQYVAQPIVQNVQSVQTVGAVQPAYAVQAVAQPVAVAQAYKQISQPVYTNSFQSIAQPVVGYGAVRTVGIQQPISVGVQQPISFGVQQPISVAVAQPGVSRFAFSQPAVAVGGLGSGTFVSGGGLSSGLLGSSGLVGQQVSGVRTVGTGQSFFSRTQTVPQSVSYQSQTTYESDDDQSAE